MAIYRLGKGVGAWSLGSSYGGSEAFVGCVEVYRVTSWLWVKGLHPRRAL
jgi:hypothetical protein